ncbi:hypothetical protein LMG28614_06988 [Paraburkholderia ultramafica]|uniref:Uncharacterized protein n=1 Tax=Paraburkholderia ultramafica TaxID=1544867 RepID=A0A6S7BQM8_9BURK|nr:hypothetical protein LMG28614_06988 [Paraburkholderia ultramafica]
MCDQFLDPHFFGSRIHRLALVSEDMMSTKSVHWSWLYGTGMMWFICLLCVGFAGAMLTALPLHLLVATAMH